MASLFTSKAWAQQQESELLNRLEHPDRTLKFEPADKAFSVSSAVGGKQAQVKGFSFGKQSATFGGEGAFRTEAFTAKNDVLRTNGYDTKTSALSQRNSFAQADREFGTKTMDVREAPSANKSAATREFVPGGKIFEVRGKRQDSIDDVYKNNKNLSVDQVRDLLNKGPAAKPQPALPQTTSAVR